MSMAFEELEKHARALTVEEKAALARILIEELDTTSDPDAELLWLEEAQHRYDAFVRGEIEAFPGDEVMKRARITYPAPRVGYAGAKHVLIEEELRSRLTALRPSGVSIPSEAGSALDHAERDPAASLTKSRVCLEAILKSTLLRYGVSMPTAALSQLIDKDSIKKRWPGLILTKLRYVNGISSAMGAHKDVPADAKHAIRVLEEVYDVLEWYASSLYDNFGNQISENEKIIIYVSRGGTCRCAMANMITRHYLTEWSQLPHIRPMSCALDQPTLPEISEDASSVVSARLGAFRGTHQSVQLDERYVRRADLIMAMDSKLLADVHHRWGILAKDKAFLFSEFFCGEGNVDDPYKKGIQAYEDCFKELDGLISQGRKRLLDRLATA